MFWNSLTEASSSGFHQTSDSHAGGLGYGRFDRGDIELYSCSLFVERSDLTATLYARYDEVSQEMMKDDERYGDPSPFKEIGYSSLGEAFDHPAQLADAVATYFDRDILEIHVPRPASFKFVINSTDRVSVSRAGLIMEGRCFRYRHPSTSPAAEVRRPESVFDDARGGPLSASRKGESGAGPGQGLHENE